jgi:hypothetical protein
MEGWGIQDLEEQKRRKKRGEERGGVEEGRVTTWVEKEKARGRGDTCGREEGGEGGREGGKGKGRRAQGVQRRRTME